MADILSENETKQNEPLTNLYRDIDGRYRWTYEMIANENPSYRNTPGSVQVIGMVWAAIC